jgi:hypothetical protein
MATPLWSRKDSVASFRLLELPTELVARICDFLPNKELVLVRLTCRALKDTALNTFGKRFFHTLVVIIHPLSLNVLLEIARHPDLSKYVRAIHICHDQVRPRDTLASKVLFDMHLSMCNSGLDQVILGEVVRSLDNLKVVAIDNIRPRFHIVGLGKYSFVWEDAYRCQAIPCRWGHLWSLFCTEKADSDEYTEPFRRECFDNWQDSFMDVYNKVLQALTSITKPEKIRLYWTISRRTDTASSNEPFQLKSDLAKVLKSCVTTLKLRGNHTPKWNQDLLEMIRGVEKLQLDGSYSAWNLAHYQGGTFCWPKLRSIALFKVVLSADTATQFFKTHAHNLEILIMDRVTFSDGRTWLDAF